MGRFPELRFGKCQVCGGTAADVAASDLTSADSTSDINRPGNGMELELYMGKVVCPTCKKWIDDQGWSRKERVLHHEAESFRAKAGFKKTVT